MSVSSGRSSSPADAPQYPVSLLVMKLLLALPTFCQYTGVPVTDLKSLEQWKECGTQGLLKHRLAAPDGPHKELYNVVGMWLRFIATRHQQDGPLITMLQQKWFNMFGRWPITIAFFITSSPSAAEPLLPPGKELGVGEVPNGMRGDTYDAAMSFKRYLTEDARDAMALPMIPVFWEDAFSLRVTLGNILRSRSPQPPGVLNHAPYLETERSSASISDPISIHTAAQELAGLSIQPKDESYPKHRSSSTTPRADSGRNVTTDGTASSDSGDSQ